MNRPPHWTRKLRHKSSASFVSWQKRILPVAIVTHQVEVARKTASRVVYMENGHIVEQGDASRFTERANQAFKNYLYEDSG